MTDHGHGAEGDVDPAENVNYRYFVEYVGEAARARPGLRVLDYGCGGGEMVALLRREGIDCRGCDIFYAGADYPDPELAKQQEDGIVREIPADGILPFDDDSFDLVISNQVFEHVEDLELVMRELGRVMSPRGRMYHHFPSREVLREAHIGIPLAHRLRPGRLRYMWTLGLRRLGLGTHKHENPDPRAWARFKLDWLDRYCTYRPYRELVEIFSREHDIRHRELDYCRFRARGRGALSRILAVPWLARPAERTFRRVAFMAIELDRRG